MEPACSNIAMQSTGNDHTNYMIRARTKCKIGREATEYWSASILMLQFRLLHPNERGGLQGTDRAATTCCLPLNRGKGNVFTRSSISKHHACIHRNYPSPSGSLTLRIDR